MASPGGSNFSELPRGGHAIREYAGGDGRLLAYQVFPASERPSAALVYLHGLESHGGWFEQAAGLLREHRHDVFLLDRRGSGLNREDRGFESGHVESLQLLLEDIRAFLEPLRAAYDRVALIGLSWGGKLVTACASAYPELVDALILITPGLKPRVGVSLAVKLGVLYGNWFAPHKRFPTPLAPELFTDNDALRRFIAEDPLRLRTATARFFMISRELDVYLRRRIPHLEIPMLLLLADSDRIIDNEGVMRLLGRAERLQLEAITYEDQAHAVQLEIPERMVDDMVRWLSASVGDRK